MSSPEPQGRWRAVLTRRDTAAEAARARGVVVDDLKELSRPTAPEIANDEIDPPNPDPENKALDAWSRNRERSISLANYLAKTWSVHGARGFLVRYGVDVCARVTEELDDLRRNDELGELRNPGGYWVAFIRDYVDRKRKERTLWHPGRPESGND